jgi:ABC-type polysaccharide/polyol phosphate transport system ATPase subunit
MSFHSIAVQILLLPPDFLNRSKRRGPIGGISKPIIGTHLIKSKIQNSKSEQSDPSSHSKSKIQNSKFEQRALREGEFMAVDNVSFTLRRGECLGLIGRNGAAPSTLLKMLKVLIKPDAGYHESVLRKSSIP